MKFSYKIKPREVNYNLTEFLSERYTYYSQEDWCNQIVNRSVSINGVGVTVDYTLKLGDDVSFVIEDFVEPPVDTNFSIVYEDEFLFAVNKSGNLPVHPAGRYRHGNLTSLLADSSLVEGEKFIVNRLDRETSGIVLFGKSSVAASKLGKLFELGKIKKTYISYVEGAFPETLSANGFLCKDQTSKIRKKKKFSYERLQDSLWEVETDFTLIQMNSGISKIYAFPRTGKIHQIRATLCSIGYPVVGDKIYGFDESLFLQFIETGACENKFSIQRQALHAYSLEFIHPITGKFLIIRAEEPPDMREIFRL